MVVVVGVVWLVVVVGKFGLAVFGSRAVAMGSCALCHYHTASPLDVPFSASRRPRATYATKSTSMHFRNASGVVW